MMAGIGCRSGATPEEILAAIDAALAGCNSARDRLSGLAVLPARAGEPGIAETARILGLPLLIVEGMLDTPTQSRRSRAATGVGSASEAAALIAAGPNGRLVSGRIVAGAVTCALAREGDAP